MNISIRLESKQDYGEVENLTREAFWDKYKPGCDEHVVAHKLRLSEGFIKQLDYVACEQDKVIGNIMYSKSKVVNGDAINEDLICLGPVSILPEYQHKGIGSLLIRMTIEKAKELNYKGIFLYGNPEYYSRFGFVNAEKFQLQTSEGTNGDYFMVLPLGPDSLKGINGKCMEDPAFHVQEEELIEFEKQFRYKEKHVTDTQLKI
jgi:predicted N-acetyltransferase YhbS